MADHSPAMPHSSAHREAAAETLPQATMPRLAPDTTATSAASPQHRSSCPYVTRCPHSQRVTPRLPFPALRSMAGSPQPRFSPQGGCSAQTPPVPPQPCCAALLPLHSVSPHTSTAAPHRARGSLPSPARPPRSATQHPTPSPAPHTLVHIAGGLCHPTLHSTPRTL